MAFYQGLASLSQYENSIDGFATIDIQLIKQSVLNLINTRKGSRIMDPEYGTNIHRVIFEQNMNVIHNSIVMDIQNAIENYEPRVEILQISTGSEGPLQDTIVVDVFLKYLEFDVSEHIKLYFDIDVNNLQKD